MRVRSYVKFLRLRFSVRFDLTLQDLTSDFLTWDEDQHSILSIIIDVIVVIQVRLQVHHSLLVILLVIAGVSYCTKCLSVQQLTVKVINVNEKKCRRFWILVTSDA